MLKACPIAMILAALLLSPVAPTTATALASAPPGAGPQAVGINLMDIVRALIRNGPRRDQKTSKGIKLSDQAANRKATLRIVDERDAGIVMMVMLESTGRELMAHTVRLLPPASQGDASQNRDEVRELRILRLETPERSGDREVVVVLLEPESLDAIADSSVGTQVELVGWNETTRLSLTPKALKELRRFRDQINSGRIG